MTNIYHSACPTGQPSATHSGVSRSYCWNPIVETEETTRDESEEEGC